MTKINQNKRQQITLTRRLGAILYDLLLLISLLLVLSTLFVIVFRLTPENPFFIIYQAFIFIISFFFYTWFWVHGGQTLGMKTWKIKITCADGTNVSWKKATIRYFIAIVSLMPLGLGFIWSVIDMKNRTWHDIASYTQLVKI